MYNWRPKEGPYSVKELSQAEDIILRSIQFNHFKQDIETLKKLEGNDNQFHSIHLHWNGCVRPVLHQRRTKIVKKMGTNIYLSLFSRDTLGNPKLDDNRLVPKCTQTLYQSQRKGS